jgi:hypothetical protein
MAVFIEKSLVTSSNCYKTIKTASILIKLGTNVDLTIAFVSTCSVLNFLLPWQRGGHLKMAKNHYFALYFSIKIDSKVLQLLNGLKKESKAFQR